MPTESNISTELTDAEAANQRGYFLPDEDERLRALFAHYLSVRSTLLEAVESIQPIIRELEKRSINQADNDDALWKLRLQSFITGFTAATMLVRAASFIVNLADERPVVSKKLDEAEDRYHIEAKSYTLVYKNLGSTRRMWRFHEATLFYEMNLEHIDRLRDDATVGSLVSILDAESAFLQYRKRDYLKRKLHYRLHSFKRRHTSGYTKVMFHLFKLSGSAIAEMKQPFVKGLNEGKRVTAEVISAIEPMLQAGDIFITRHDDALSNLFLPGFWPHAALYIGTESERQNLGINIKPPAKHTSEDIRFLEAKKDGVFYRPIQETLKVDAFLILRPQLDKNLITQALQNAISHEGKLYDFLFDFSQSSRLACTAVIYRGFHGVGPVSFSLIQHAGRSCLSAEELIKQCSGSQHFSCFADYGVKENSIRLLGSHSS